MTSGDNRPDREIQTRTLYKLAIGLVVLVSLAFLSMWQLSGILYESEVAKDPPPPLLAEARVPHQPPAPRLQSNPLTDITTYRATATARLHSYGWSDAARGMAHIPIDRAIDLIVEQGLPVSLAPEVAIVFEAEN